MIDDEDPAQPDNDGSLAPVEGANAEKQDLPDGLETRLLSLINHLMEPDAAARRALVRKIKRHRLYWKGDQYIYWAENVGDWLLYRGFTQQGGFQQNPYGDAQALEDSPFMTTTNIYLAYGLAIEAIVGANRPTTVWTPQNAQEEGDVETADAAEDVTEYIDKTNDIDRVKNRLCYFFENDGGAFVYTRYVVDGQRFGYHDEDVIDLVDKQIQEPDSYQCANCGTPGTAPPGTVDSNQPATCESCGVLVAPEIMVPGAMLSAKVPAVVGKKRVPNGQVVHTAFGRLEVRCPMNATEKTDCGYMRLDREINISKLKAAYPKLAAKLTSAGTGDPNQTYERTVRQNLLVPNVGSMATGMTVEDYPTFSIVWLRPEEYFMLEDDDRDALLAAYPDGLCVKFVGSTVCEIYGESIDDVWSMRNAYEGEGQATPAILEPIADVQDRVNTLESIRLETFSRGIPPQLVDTQMINYKEYNRRAAQPVDTVPVTPKSGRKAEDAIFNPKSPEVSPQLEAHWNMLFNAIPQFLVGAFPASYGGNTGDNDTAHGIAMERDAAMGRLGLVWRGMKAIFCDADMNGVEQFRRNASDDVVYSVLSEATARFEARILKLASLKGNLAAAPQSDDDYPVTALQKRGMFMQLLSSPSPAIQGVVGENVTAFKTMMGARELTIPGEKATIQQMREITVMKNMRVPIPVDPVLEDHDSHIKACHTWAASDEGQWAKINDPGLYQMVCDHSIAHEKAKVTQAILIQQAEQMAAMQAGALPPPGGGPPPQPGPGGPPAPAQGPGSMNPDVVDQGGVGPGQTAPMGPISSPMGSPQ